MSGEDEYEYPTPAGDEKTAEAGEDPLQEVEMQELEAITDLEDKATIDDRASMDERQSALEALDRLLLKIRLEEHHDPTRIATFKKWIHFLQELYQHQDEESKHKFIEYTENVREMIVDNLADLLQSNGGQSNQIEEAKQATPWEQLGLSQAE